MWQVAVAAVVFVVVVDGVCVVAVGGQNLALMSRIKDLNLDAFQISRSKVAPREREL